MVLIVGIDRDLQSTPENISFEICLFYQDEGNGLIQSEQKPFLSDCGEMENSAASFWVVIAYSSLPVHIITKFAMIILSLCLLTAVAALADHCSLQLASAPICILCDPGYIINLNGTCSPQNVPYCALFMNNICVTCQPTFKLVQGFCLKDYSGCIEYNQSGLCSRCSLGTTLSDGKCIGVLHCSKYGSQGRCEQCASGFQSTNGTCVDSSKTCANRDNNSGACLKCEQKHYLFGFSCVPENKVLQRCLLYNQKFECEKCLLYFTVDPKLKTCIQLGEKQSTDPMYIVNVYKASMSQEPPQVRTFGGDGNSNPTKITINPTKPTSNDNITVVKTTSEPSSSVDIIIPNAVNNTVSTNATSNKSEITNPIGNNSSTATASNSNNTSNTTKNSNGTTVQNKTQNNSVPSSNNNTANASKITIEFCQQYNGQACLKCLEGYALKDNRCSIGILGCLQLDPKNKSRCSKCDEKYQTQAGKCVDASCDRFGPEGKSCLSCRQGFVYNQTLGLCYDQYCAQFKNGSCIKCKTRYFKSPKTSACIDINTTNCVTYKSPSCVMCPPEYFPTLAGCVVFVPGCFLFDFDNGDCRYCEDALLLVNGTCKNVNCNQTSDKKCTQCKTGYQLSQTGTCVDPNCAKYNYSTCSTCKSNFLLSNSNFCVPKPENCNTSNQNGECLKCADNFKLVDGQCKTMNIEHCRLLDQSKKCVVCDQGYYNSMDKSTCTMISYLCKQFNPQTGYCFTCIAGAINKDGVCSDSNCLNKSALSCLQCAKGYTLNATSKICESGKKDPWCKDPSSLKCTECQTGYYLSPAGECLKKPDGCESVNITGGDCLACQTTFINVNGRCTPQIPISNCANPSTSRIGQCSICNTNYYLTLNKKCQQVSKLCSPGLYDASNGRCLQCVRGFDLVPSSGICLKPNCIEQNPNNQTACLRCAPNFKLNDNFNCVFNGSNCQKSSDSECEVCSEGYYKEGIYCYLIPANCSIAQNKGLACKQCKEGFRLNSILGCEKIPVSIPNCRAYSGDRCRQCLDSHFLKDNACIAVSKGCGTFNPSTGACLSCITGYNFDSKNVTCVPLPAASDRNCKRFIAGVCQECSNRYYPNEDRVCVPVNPQCKDYDANSGVCTSCYPSYVVLDGKCVPIIDDSKCKEFVNKTDCRICFQGYYPSQGKCTGVNPLCQTYNQTNGYCLSCFLGYSLQGTACAISFQDPNCRTFNEDKSCKECGNRYFLKGPVCSPVNPLCKDYNFTDGKCTSCYPGYSIVQGSCELGQAQNSLANCRNVTQNVCVECYVSYYLSKGECRAVNPLCKEYNKNTGDCTSCYSGYEVSGGRCVIMNSPNIDRNCKKLSPSDLKVCDECYQGYRVADGKCVERDDQCSQFTQVGNKCLKCYPGYTLNAQGKCVVSLIANQAAGEANCIQQIGSSCVKCSDGYFLNQRLKCQQVNPQCQTITLAGKCATCYQGFLLREGDCLDPANSRISIPYCDRYDDSGRCTQCADRYILKDNQCIGVSILCGIYNETTGQCKSCTSPFYNLQGGTCIQLVKIVEGCFKYQGPYCSECNKGYYFSSYDCVKVSQKCVNFDYSRGVCVGCGGGLRARGANCE